MSNLNQKRKKDNVVKNGQFLLEDTLRLVATGIIDIPEARIILGIDDTEGAVNE
jgi:hypothetical protein